MDKKKIHTVHSLACHLNLWEQVEIAVSRNLNDRETEKLLAEVSTLPVYKSRATRTLGTYVSKNGKPYCIRLQFALEQELLKETFLHELAHVCDHRHNQNNRPYRRAHGPGWKRWATALGIEGKVRGKSEVLSQLYMERLKTVAICHSCGAEFKRLRRLNQKQSYTHLACGGRLVVI